MSFGHDATPFGPRYRGTGNHVDKQDVPLVALMTPDCTAAPDSHNLIRVHGLVRFPLPPVSSFDEFL